MKTQKKSIGIDQKRFDAIIESYRLLNDNLNALFASVQEIFSEFSVSELFELVQQARNIEYWLQRRYIEKNHEKFSGFNPDKVIQQGLLDLPSFDQIKKFHFEVRNSLAGHYQAINTVHFYYPMIDLFDGERFAIDNEFIAKAKEDCTKFVETDEQHAIYAAMQQMLPALNALKKYNLMGHKNVRLEDQFAGMSDAFINENDEIKIRPTAFSTGWLRSYATPWTEKEKPNMFAEG